MKDKEMIEPLCEGWQNLNSCKTCKNTECDNNRTKEKQIEEMAKDLKEIENDKGHQLINETLAYVKEHHKYNPKKDYSLAHTKTIHELVAEELIKQGYRKIDKDSVVLSREELNEQLNKAWDRGIEYGKEIASKETAEKIIRETIDKLIARKAIVKSFYSISESVGIDMAIDEVKKLAKHFGVEIKEN